MTNIEILETITTLKYLANIDDNDISKIAQEKIKELLGKLDFEEKEKKDDKGFQENTIGKVTKLSYEDLEKQFNELVCKLQTGELVEKRKLFEVNKESEKWFEAYYHKRELIHAIESKWYFRLFGNMDKIHREIALEKAIQAKM